MRENNQVKLLEYINDITRSLNHPLPLDVETLTIHINRIEGLKLLMAGDEQQGIEKIPLEEIMAIGIKPSKFALPLDIILSNAKAVHQYMAEFGLTFADITWFANEKIRDKNALKLILENPEQIKKLLALGIEWKYLESIACTGREVLGYCIQYIDNLELLIKGNKSQGFPPMKPTQIFPVRRDINISILHKNFDTIQYVNSFPDVYKVGFQCANLIQQYMKKYNVDFVYILESLATSCTLNSYKCPSFNWLLEQECNMEGLAKWGFASQNTSLMPPLLPHRMNIALSHHKQALIDFLLTNKQALDITRKYADIIVKYMYKYNLDGNSIIMLLSYRDRELEYRKERAIDTPLPLFNKEYLNKSSCRNNLHVGGKRTNNYYDNSSSSYQLPQVSELLTMPEVVEKLTKAEVPFIDMYLFAMHRPEETAILFKKIDLVIKLMEGDNERGIIGIPYKDLFRLQGGSALKIVLTYLEGLYNYMQNDNLIWEQIRNLAEKSKGDDNESIELLLKYQKNVSKLLANNIPFNQIFGFRHKIEVFRVLVMNADAIITLINGMNNSEYYSISWKELYKTAKDSASIFKTLLENADSVLYYMYQSRFERHSFDFRVFISSAVKNAASKSMETFLKNREAIEKLLRCNVPFKDLCDLIDHDKSLNVLVKNVNCFVRMLSGDMARGIFSLPWDDFFKLAKINSNILLFILKHVYNEKQYTPALQGKIKQIISLFLIKNITEADTIKILLKYSDVTINIFQKKENRIKIFQLASSNSTSLACLFKQIKMVEILINGNREQNIPPVSFYDIIEIATISTPILKLILNNIEPIQKYLKGKSNQYVNKLLDTFTIIINLSALPFNTISTIFMAEISGDHRPLVDISEEYIEIIRKALPQQDKQQSLNIS